MGCTCQHVDASGDRRRKGASHPLNGRAEVPDPRRSAHQRLDQSAGVRQSLCRRSAADPGDHQLSGDRTSGSAAAVAIFATVLPGVFLGQDRRSAMKPLLPPPTLGDLKRECVTLTQERRRRTGTSTRWRVPEHSVPRPMICCATLRPANMGVDGSPFDRRDCGIAVSAVGASFPFPLVPADVG